MFCKTLRWQTHTLARETGRLMQILTFASCTASNPSSSLIFSSAANCLLQLTPSSLPSYPADHLEPLTQPSLLSHICLAQPPAPESPPWKPTGPSGQGSSQASCRPLPSPPRLQIQSFCLIPQQTAYRIFSFLSAPTTGRSYKSFSQNLSLHSLLISAPSSKRFFLHTQRKQQDSMQIIVLSLLSCQSKLVISPHLYRTPSAVVSPSSPTPSPEYYKIFLSSFPLHSSCYISPNSRRLSAQSSRQTQQRNTQLN